MVESGQKSEAMKKLFALSLILLLLSLAASSQRTWNRLPGRPAILRERIIRLSPEQYRLRTEKMRLQIAREKILRDGIVSPVEKRKLRKVKRYHREKPIKKRKAARRLS